jgi:quercetin dioxygenase-like cupin family protein
MQEINVVRWQTEEQPDEASLRSLMRAEGLQPYAWGNPPNDRYAAHSHAYHKVIVVVSGSILFGLPETGEEIKLEVGDRLEIPAGTVHHAVVGPYGVRCLEAQC